MALMDGMSAKVTGSLRYVHWKGRVTFIHPFKHGIERRRVPHTNSIHPFVVLSIGFLFFIISNISMGIPRNVDVELWEVNVVFYVFLDSNILCIDIFSRMLVQAVNNFIVEMDQEIRWVKPVNGVVFISRLILKDESLRVHVRVVNVVFQGESGVVHEGTIDKVCGSNTERVRNERLIQPIWDDVSFVKLGIGWGNLMRVVSNVIVKERSKMLISRVGLVMERSLNRVV